MACTGNRGWASGTHTNFFTKARLPRNEASRGFARDSQSFDRPELCISWSFTEAYRSKGKSPLGEAKILPSRSLQLRS
ncbi:hypothetical protein MPNT_100016 [Candidatus Methylacidithermus pantelleriae]|uniref:Uncharacterized protein n=1 Tax=Candidatus Methylacidithermus pantelleriae TaxID=2744239 RepID=A0A8J2BM62_9BACT|nr:hypothetical protein MPNT_100016 [Candidatus Methylacidithermus pantelleriae]